MSIIAWNRDLETGIPDVDAQHQQFLSAANMLYVKAKILSPDKVCSDTFDFLFNFFDTHFKTEEAFMAESHYSGFREHQAIHSETKMKVRQMQILAESNNYPPECLQELVDFMNHTVEHHMYVDDLEFAAYYKQYLRS